MKKISYKITIENLRTAGHKDDSILSIIRAMSQDNTLTIESAMSDQNIETLAYKNNETAINEEIAKVLTKYGCPFLRFRVYTGTASGNAHSQFDAYMFLSSKGYSITEPAEDGTRICTKGKDKWIIPKSHGNGLAWHLEADALKKSFSDPQPCSPKYLTYFQTNYPTKKAVK